MRSGQVSLEKYIITKTLTKPPEAYPDAKNQPHVQVSSDPDFTIIETFLSYLRNAFHLSDA
jgi:hypothetical protein